MEFMQTTQYGIQQNQNMMWQTMQSFFVQQQVQMSQIIERQNTRDRQFGDVLAGIMKKQGLMLDEKSEPQHDDANVAPAGAAAPVGANEGP
eukprot:1979420-Karenia_brevis.AAC.1